MIRLVRERENQSREVALDHPNNLDESIVADTAGETLGTTAASGWQTATDLNTASIQPDPGHPHGSDPGRRLLAVARVSLSRGLVALVDPGDFHLVSGRVWRHRERSGKRFTYTLDLSGSRREVLMHHLLLEIPEGSVVVHVNHNGLDNRRSNLRIVDRRGAYAHSQVRCGIPGVWYDPTVPGWRAEVLCEDGLLILGPFDDAETAKQARAAIATHESRRLARLVERLNVEEDLEGLEEPPPAQAEEPQGSVRGVRAVRNGTGVAGVSWDATAGRYLVRVDGPARRFKRLSEARREASIALTLRAKYGMEPGAGERVVHFGRHSVLLDKRVAEWLPQLHRWSVRRRTSGLLDVRRQPSAGDDCDARYLTAADYLVAPGPGERVKFINGNRLDLRVANLKIVPRRGLSRPTPPAEDR